MRDSVRAWNKSPTWAQFEPPPIAEKLHERCERVCWLLETTEINSYSADIRRAWMRTAAGIIEDVRRASDGRQQFLHPLATEQRRNMCMYVVEFHLEKAYNAAKELARELERDRLIKKRSLPKGSQQAPAIRALKRAILVLGHQENWCKDAFAKDRNKRKTTWDSPKAYAFSIVGALHAATQALDADQQRMVFHCVGTTLTCKDIQELQDWNDKIGTSHADIVQALQSAITLLEKGGPPRQHSFNL